MSRAKMITPYDIAKSKAKYADNSKVDKKNIDTIIPYKEFVLMDKSMQLILMRHWRSIYKMSEIRKHMKVDNGKLYRLIGDLGISTRQRYGKQLVDAVKEQEQEAVKQEIIEVVEDAYNQGNILEDISNNGSNNSNLIDDDVIDDNLMPKKVEEQEAIRKSIKLSNSNPSNDKLEDWEIAEVKEMALNILENRLNKKMGMSVAVEVDGKQVDSTQVDGKHTYTEEGTHIEEGTLVEISENHAPLSTEELDVFDVVGNNSKEDNSKEDNEFEMKIKDSLLGAVISMKLEKLSVLFDGDEDIYDVEIKIKRTKKREDEWVF